MLKRVITGLILIACGNYVIISGAWPLFIWTIGFSLVAAYELFALLRNSNRPCMPLIGYVLIFGIGILCTPFGASFGFELASFYSLLHGLAIVILGINILEFAIKKPLFFRSSVYVTLKIVLLIGVTMAHGLLLRMMPHGVFYLYFAVLMVGIGDTAALFVGKAIGKHPLSTISPKKTIEGFLGHMFFDVLFAVIFVWVSNTWFAQDFGVERFLIFAVILSVVSQIGDIHESLYKRFFNVKDSSNLLPGHGGFYDRLDSYLFALPVAFILFAFL